ncbi:hypothetical protein HDK77DRAFT_289684 [Phyllosticta capitalensis]
MSIFFSNDVDHFTDSGSRQINQSTQRASTLLLPVIQPLQVSAVGSYAFPDVPRRAIGDLIKRLADWLNERRQVISGLNISSLSWPTLRSSTTAPKSLTKLVTTIETSLPSSLDIAKRSFSLQTHPTSHPPNARLPHHLALFRSSPIKMPSTTCQPLTIAKHVFISIIFQRPPITVLPVSLSPRAFAHSIPSLSGQSVRLGRGLSREGAAWPGENELGRAL